MKNKVSWFNEIPLKVFFVLSIVGTFYFYGNAELVLFRLPSYYEGIAFIIYIFSGGIFICSLIILIYKYLRNSLQDYRIKKYYKRVYSNLDRYEVAVIREFYIFEKNTMSFPFSEPIIQGLVDKRVLINTSNVGGSYIIDGLTASYTINQNIRELINPCDIGLVNNATKKQKEFILKNRPYWLQDK